MANHVSEDSLTSVPDELDAEVSADYDVLVVEDDPFNLAAIEAALADLRVRVVSAASGEDALRQVVRHTFALVLLDVNLPGLSGFEVARLIRSRERSKHLPIIFITANNLQHNDVRRGYELGAVDYLSKPVLDDVLRAKVRVFVELHHRTLQVAQQAEMLRQAERVEARRALEEERRRWEAAELRRQVRHERLVNEQLSLADRRKDEFIALLAHELRNPLMPLVMGLRLISAREAADPVVAETCEKMERQISHLKRLVDDLTDVARIRQGKLEMNREPIDLRDVIEQAREMCRGAFSRRHQSLRVEEVPYAVNVIADPVRMTQVLCNLLTNASRYSDCGRRVWVRCGLEEGHAVVRVLDEGRGMEPGHIEQMFEPFVQEREGGRGLGLGLALVRQIVEKHGGVVEASSEGPGCGSEFVVRLPAAQLDHAPLCDAVMPLVSAARTAALRVVVVDDCVDIRELLSNLVQAWGHTVVGSASTGQEALERMLLERPDVAVVDIGLPDCDGYEVARRIHEALGEQRPGLVAVSGYGQDRDLRLATDAGFDELLVKPPEPAVLREVLERVGRSRRGGNSTTRPPGLVAQ